MASSAHLSGTDELTSAAFLSKNGKMSFNNNVGSFNHLSIHLSGENPILAWLSPLEPRIQHEVIQADRVPNVGDRLLQTEAFRTWSDVSRQDHQHGNATLFYYGNPGSGKTYITSLVIDKLGEQANDQNTIVASFYFASQKEQSPRDMLGALLRQIVFGLAEIPGEIVKAYRDSKRVSGGPRPQLPKIMEMFQTVPTSQHIFICVDALDECVAGYRRTVLQSLREILKKSPSTRLLLTGRSNIRSEIQYLFAEAVTFIDIGTNRGDTVRYIRAKLEKDANKDAMNDCLRAEVLAEIPAMFSEILLVSLTVEAILEEQKISTRRDRLQEMTSSLGGVHARMLRRVKEQGKSKEEIGMAALMWVSHSERPLSVDELCHALAVEIRSTDLDPDSAPSIETLLECCQGLLMVDKEAAVRLAFSTLQEYLSTCPGLFDKAHSTIAETCLTYLNFQQFKGLSTSDLSDPARETFLEYSSRYWGTHAKRELSDCAKSLALELLDDYNDHISAKSLLRQVLGPNRFSDIRSFSSFTGLHCASFFGIVDVVVPLMERNGCDVHQVDCVGNTPLEWAFRNDHEGIVKLLQDATPDILRRPSHTPPPHATSLKRERVDEQLLPESGAPKRLRTT